MEVLQHLIDQFERLPGVGAKTAERLAYHLLKVPRDEAMALAHAVQDLKEKVRECARCCNIAEAELCTICADETRDGSVVCVVEQPKDLHAVEQTGQFRGLYHVLGGNVSALEGRGIESLTIRRLKERVEGEGVNEVILATNPDFEGDGTAMQIAELLGPSGVSISRIARGVPTGSHLEYMNRSIIGDALTGRTAYGGGEDGPGSGEPPSP